MSVITLLTDFGTRDEYAGVMKGVILSIDPSAVIVDISHRIQPQNILQAAGMIQAAHPFFPRDSVHIVVVDPGVGSDRRIIALQTARCVFLAPDNGVLSAVMDSEVVETMVRVENSRYFLTPVSRTFHGRDVFAPVGAHLSRGLHIRQLGPDAAATEPVRLRMPEPRIAGSGKLIGTVIAVDRFGNLVTCIDAAILDTFRRGASTAAICTAVGQSEIFGIRPSYSHVPVGQPVVLIGSRGMLEIGVNGGSAEKHCRAGTGDTVVLTLEPGQRAHCRRPAGA